MPEAPLHPPEVEAHDCESCFRTGKHSFLYTLDILLVMNEDTLVVLSP